MNIKKNLIAVAEVIDAWRIIPRLGLVAYSYLVYKIYVWIIAIPTYVEEKCDVGLMQFFLDKGIPIDTLQDFACRTVDVVGGPTSAQSAFATTIIGLSAAVFGLYTSTGRSWSSKNKNQIPNIVPPVVVNYPPTHSNSPPTTPTPLKDDEIPNSEIDEVKFEP